MIAPQKSQNLGLVTMVIAPQKSDLLKYILDKF